MKYIEAEKIYTCRDHSQKLEATFDQQLPYKANGRWYTVEVSSDPVLPNQEGNPPEYLLTRDPVTYTEALFMRPFRGLAMPLHAAFVLQQYYRVRSPQSLPEDFRQEVMTRIAALTERLATHLSRPCNLSYGE